MIRTFLIAGSAALFAAWLTSPSSAADDAISEGVPPACFNFRNVTDYKLADPGHIQIKTKNLQSFGVALAGPECAGAADLESIAKAPIAELCAGPQRISRAITFERKDGTSIQCDIADVSIASPSEAPPKN